MVGVHADVAFVLESWRQQVGVLRLRSCSTWLRAHLSKLLLRLLHLALIVHPWVLVARIHLHRAWPLHLFVGLLLHWLLRREPLVHLGRIHRWLLLTRASHLLRLHLRLATHVLLHGSSRLLVLLSHLLLLWDNLWTDLLNLE